MDHGAATGRIIRLGIKRLGRTLENRFFCLLCCHQGWARYRIEAGSRPKMNGTLRNRDHHGNWLDLASIMHTERVFDNNLR